MSESQRLPTDGAKNPLVSIKKKKKILLQKPIPKFYILKIKITFENYFFSFSKYSITMTV